MFNHQSKAIKPLIITALLGSMAFGLLGCGADNSDSNANTSTNANAEPAKTAQPSQPTPADSQTDTATANTTASNASSDTPAQPTQNAPKTTGTLANVDWNDPKMLAIGKQRYETNCHLCHLNGLLNAPKPNDKIAWQPRLAKGLEVLQYNAIVGFGKMPAQAVDGVSEQEVAAAVAYMVSQVEKQK